jgi:hypothetical protein
MPIRGHNLLATALIAQDRQASQALLAAYGSSQKWQDLQLAPLLVN